MQTDDAAGVAAGAEPGPPHERSLENASEAALLRAARLGDEVAFGHLVDRHGPAMLRYARRLTGEEHDARDVVQEAFVSAWRELPGFEGRSSLRTWLFRIVHRRAVDSFRVRRPVPVEEEVIARREDDGRAAGLLGGGSVDDPVLAAVHTELLAALQVALGELSPPQRGVWLLREVEGLSYDEIAAVMDLPVGSVRGHLHRGRKALAARMAPWR